MCTTATCTKHLPLTSQASLPLRSQAAASGVLTRLVEYDVVVSGPGSGAARFPIVYSPFCQCDGVLLTPRVLVSPLVPGSLFTVCVELAASEVVFAQSSAWTDFTAVDSAALEGGASSRSRSRWQCLAMVVPAEPYLALAAKVPDQASHVSLLHFPVSQLGDA